MAPGEHLGGFGADVPEGDKAGLWGEFDIDLCAVAAVAGVGEAGAGGVSGRSGVGLDQGGVRPAGQAASARADAGAVNYARRFAADI